MINLRMSDRYYVDSEGNLHPVTVWDKTVEVGSAIAFALLTAYGISLMVIL